MLTAPADGVLTRLDALAVGVAAWRLGAGRARKEDPVQAGAGVELHAKPGDTVRAGAAAADPAHRHAGPVRAALDDLSGAFSIGADGPAGHGADFTPRPLILERVSA